MAVDYGAMAVVELGVFLIAFMKGAFGGGFAILGIPLLSLVMDPIIAGMILAPLFVLMDLCALRYWRPATWSKPDLVMLVPALVAGIGIGYLVLRGLDHRAVSIVIAVISLAFSGLWFFRGGSIQARPRSRVKAVVAGASSGVTTMVAHSGGPPLAMYLLPLDLPKNVYAGTTSLFFTIGNVIKAGPWLALATPGREFWTMVALCLPVIPLGIWAGWNLHHRCSEIQLYRSCYLLLVVTALKLLWDGVSPGF